MNQRPQQTAAIALLWFLWDTYSIWGAQIVEADWEHIAIPQLTLHTTLAAVNARQGGAECADWAP